MAADSRKSLIDQLTNEPELVNPENYEDNEELTEICHQNLSIIRQFLLQCKCSLAAKKNCLVAVDALGNALRHIEKRNLNNENCIDEEKICEVVEKAIGNKLNSTPITSRPTYSQIAGSQTTQSKHDTVVKTIHKVLVKPSNELQNIKSAEDTRRLLVSKSPKDYGIKPDKIILMRNNAVLIESSCDSLLDLGNNEAFKSLKLKAERIDKSWPKIQVFDIPERMTEEEILENIADQNLPASIPQKFARNAFKINQRSGSHDASTSWVIEIHPALRNYLIKIGKIYTSWRAHSVRDYIRVTRCYRCQKYGHVAKHCKSNPQCGMCASTDHETKNCRHTDHQERHKCSNCIRNKFHDTNHHTGSSDCPVYVKRLKDLINSIDYPLDG